MISDPLNPANTQNCAYGHDDLARLASANCGSVWAQTFGYDPFGNISKSGSVSFQPTYNTATNRVSSAPFTFDANGNTLTDNVHSYTWDAEGKVITSDGLALTYDALGRMVEQGGTTQIVYSPTGEKFALMTGQTVSKAFVPLPGGAQAVYSGTTLAYFRHPDWLGSSRLSTTPSRTLYSSVAYAPFGETYAESGTPDRSFTGQNQDTIAGSTAGLYDFLFREYAQYGRWISPDPAGLSAAMLGSPQSWNRYAYVLNNPLRYVDPLGLVCSWNDGPPDDPPEDGGANEAECIAQGGVWEDPVTGRLNTGDSVTVNGGFPPDIEVQISGIGNVISVGGSGSADTCGVNPVTGRPGFNPIPPGMPGHLRPGNVGGKGYFGAPRSDNPDGHQGLDISGGIGGPIYANLSGIVLFSGVGASGNAGNMIIVDSGNGVTQRYVHNSANWVRTGNFVFQGIIIGSIGQTGNASKLPESEVHLHFNVQVNGQNIDPAQYLNSKCPDQ